MSATRRPALRILADGAPVRGALAAETRATSSATAATWHVRLALAAAGGLAVWDDAPDTVLEVQASLDGLGWASLVTGRIDRVSADPVRGVLSLSGRDLAASLIEQPLAESFSNQTASDIATLLAGRHGLSADVAPTTTPVGRYYGNSHDRLTLHRHARAGSEWDLLALLARQEGFDCYVAGTTLVFQPQDPQPVPAMVLGTALGGADLTGLRLSRAANLAGPMSVSVQSWNSQLQSMQTGTATRSSAQGSARSFGVVRPNLTAAEAQSLAQLRLEGLIRHEWQLDATMPGELMLTPRMAVALAGTGSAFDAAYVIDELHRRIDLRAGFTQSLRAHVPQTTD